MKKFLGIILVLLFSITLVSCNTKKDNSNNDQKVYVYYYDEEIGGQVNTFENILILNSDSTGYYIVQDIVPIKWDERSIYSYTTDHAYSYEMIDDETLVLENYFGDKEEYKLSIEPLDEATLSLIADCDSRNNEMLVEE